MNKKKKCFQRHTVLELAISQLPLVFSILGYFDPMERFSTEVTQDSDVYLGGSIILVRVILTEEPNL